MGRRNDIDWAGIESDYRLDAKTLQELSAYYGTAISSITRRAKREGWSKDLSHEVRAATRAKTQERIAKNAQATLKECSDHNAHAVETAAISNALLIAEHEKGAAKGRELMVSILDRIDAQLKATPESIEKLLEIAGEDEDALRQGMRKVMAIPSLVDSAKKAIDGHKSAADQERKARNLDDLPPTPDDSAFESLLNKAKQGDEDSA